MSLSVEKTMIARAGGCSACGSPYRRCEDVVYQVELSSREGHGQTVRFCPMCLAELVEKARQRMGA